MRTRPFVLLALALVAFAPWALADEPRPPKEPELPKELSPTPVTASVTLEEAVRRALARNPDAEVAAKEIARAEALAKQARAAWMPTLDVNATYTRIDDDRELSGRVILSANQLHGNVSLRVPIIAGRQWVEHSQAKAAVGVARAAFADTRREVALATARAYLAVVAEHRVLKMARGAFRTTSAHEAYTTTRFQGGVGNRLDAVRASQERAAAEVRLRNQLTALARAQEALGVMIGEAGPVDAAQDPTLDVPVSVDVALGEATTRRADVAAHRDRLELARKTARESWVEYLPVLSAIAQPFYQNPPTYSNPLTGWTAQLVLGVPLFDGGERYGRREERIALEAQARARLEGALRQARSEVRIAFEAMRRADEALVVAREADRLAKEALSLAELAYEAGATSNIEVVDAERRAREAETNAVIAEDASRQARLDLLAACGRFP